MIIYDIDTLGERLHHQGAQTGVFRVVETIAEGIAQDPMLQPVWHAEQFHDPAKAYLQANAKLRGFPMLATEKKPSHFYTSLYNHLTQLQANDSRHPENQARLVPKAYRKVLSVARRVLTPSPPQRTLHTNPALLANSRIYHATWWKPPTHIRNHRHLTFFYTIYDLIPMLYPQYVGHNADYPSKRMMEDMDEQSWGLSISQSSKNDLCNYNQRINPDKVLVTPLAADRRIFYPEKKEETLAAVRKKYGVPDAPYLLSLSTLAPHKNIIHVIQSFFKLLEQQHIKDLNLVLVGAKGWEFEDIFHTISEYRHLQSRIIVTGRAAEEDLSALYSGALGFAFMSFYEGFGLPPLEAMQCGVPVITSNTSSLPEVVGDAGIMLDPKDEDGLCQAMLDVYGSASLREEMSRKSLQQAAKFSWDKTVSQTIQGYKMALQL